MTRIAQGQKVLIVAKAYPPDVGGVESYSEFVSRAYLARGITPLVVSSWNGPRGWVERQYPEGSIQVLNVGPGQQTTVFARLVLACMRVLSAHRFAWAHATTWRPALALLPFKGRLPLVLSVHGQEVSRCPKLQKWAMRQVLCTTDLLIAVSHATMTITRQALGSSKPKGQWEVGFNGLSFPDEARRFTRVHSITGKTLQILTFCRLAERKNIQGCLAAIALLRDSGIRNFTYTIAGTGPLKENLLAQIKTLKLQDLVQMTGYVPESEIPDLYRHADIFLHPQTTAGTGVDIEGFGLAIADSMSFGAAVVVGKDGGPADFVKNGDRGIVIDGDDVSEIAAALRSLLTNPELLSSLAESGRTWTLENLSWDYHVAKIIQKVGGTSQG
jgi:phosphatidylinositol alpha-1,6-mannosyltransferase